MKGQKQSRIDSLEKRIAGLHYETTNVLRYLENEIVNLKTMVFGHQQIIKHLEGYEDAIEEIKKKVAEEPSETEEAFSSREDS